MKIFAIIISLVFSILFGYASLGYFKDALFDWEYRLRGDNTMLVMIGITFFIALFVGILALICIAFPILIITGVVK